jgi:hypothetical protein
VKFKLSKLKSMILVRKSELAQIVLGLAQLKSYFSACKLDLQAYRKRRGVVEGGINSAIVG